MILLILLASILIVSVTILQYDEQTKEYNTQRFGRKEEATKQNIEIELNTTTYGVTTNNLSKIFQNKIYEIATIHKLTISMYDMSGKLLKSSIPYSFDKAKEIALSKEILMQLALNSEHRVVPPGKKEKEVTYGGRFKKMARRKMGSYRNRRRNKRSVWNE